MFVKIMLKRVDQIETGDIVRSVPGDYQIIRAWGTVDRVENDEEAPITRLGWYRPRTVDGQITDPRAPIARSGALVPSWTLVEVQTLITQSGEAR